mgnify:CR=1 FL=1
MLLELFVGSIGFAVVDFGTTGIWFSEVVKGSKQAFIIGNDIVSRIVMVAVIIIHLERFSFRVVFECVML